MCNRHVLAPPPRSAAAARRAPRARGTTSKPRSGPHPRRPTAPATLPRDEAVRALPQRSAPSRPTPAPRQPRNRKRPDRQPQSPGRAALPAGAAVRRSALPAQAAPLVPTQGCLAPIQVRIVGSKGMRFAAALALSACLLAACAPKAPTTAKATPSPRSIPTPIAASPSPEPSAPPSPSHIFVIVMENRSYDQVIGNGYIAQLAAKYGVATDYHGVSHPSLPNYLAMTSGSTRGIADDGFHALPAGGLGTQLTDAGIEWRAYMEGMTNGCFRSPYPYALKHNPFAYYASACPPQVVPLTQLAPDVAGAVPQFVWITPNLCHDGHDCSSSVADAWLAQTVPSILSSNAWQDGGMLGITWDEGEDSANSVLTLIVRPDPATHTSAKPYDHYSLLATIEDLLGVARLGQAAH